METPWRIQLLGDLSLYREGQSTGRFRTRAAATLLAHLALHLNRRSNREELCEAIWPDSDPTVSRRRLREELASLRRQLEPPGYAKGSVLEADHNIIRLCGEAATCDVTDFEAAVARSQTAASEAERLNFLRIAESLYAGVLLPGFYGEWVETARDRLSENYDWTLRQIVESLAASEQLTDAAHYGLKLVQLNPLDELAHEKVLDILLRQGQVDIALSLYKKLQENLAEIGEKPQEPLRLLMENQRKVKPAAAPPPASKPKKVAFYDAGKSLARPSLPYLRNPFFGREAEKAHMLERLHDDRVRLSSTLGS